MTLTPEQITLIDAWLPELDIPQPDAGHEAWHTGTVVMSMVNQLYYRLKSNGFQASREALTDYILERVRNATNRRP